MSDSITSTAEHIGDLFKTLAARTDGGAEMFAQAALMAAMTQHMQVCGAANTVEALRLYADQQEQLLIHEQKRRLKGFRY